MSDISATLAPTGAFESWNPVLAQAFRTREVCDQAGNPVGLHSNVGESEARQLYEWVRKTKPKRTVEIGFCQGISATAILQALEDNGEGEHWVVDPFQASYGNAGLAMVQRAGLSHRLHFHECFPEEVLPRLDVTFQAGFIDASHLFDLTVLDFILVDKKLDPGGVIGLHDMWMPSLQKVWRYLTSNRSYQQCDDEFRVVDGAPARLLPLRTRLKCGLSSMAARMPAADRYFSQEFLQPWETLRVPNLALLRKPHTDSREWTHHRPF